MSRRDDIMRVLEDEDARVALSHCGTWDYFESQLGRFLEGSCPFCQRDPELNPELSGSNKHWVVQHSAFPKQHSELHLLLIPRRHITHLNALDLREWIALLRAGRWVFKNFDPKGGGIIWRFGPLKYTAASIAHSHINIIIPNLEGEIREPLAKTPKKVVRNNARLDWFISYAVRGDKPTLTWEEFMQNDGSM